MPELTNDQVERLGALADALKTLETGKKDPATTHTGFTLHGPTGIFGSLGLNREIISAHVTPDGVGELLPMLPSRDEDPRFGSFTGVTDTHGAEPTNECDDAPAAYMKGCNLTARFGLVRRDTNDINWDTIITRTNRGDFEDLVLFGNIVGKLGPNAGMLPSDLDPGQILNIVTMAEMVAAGVSAQRELLTQMWQGTTATANQFPGLDSQIATGQVDADTGQACPALDSDVKSFAYDDVAGTGRDIVRYMSMMEYYLRFNARRMGLMPVEWAVVMRPELWQELSRVWPCRYNTDSCSDSSGTQVMVINDNANVDLRNDMRDRMRIPINGVFYPVVEDDGIFEHNNTNNGNLNAGEYASSIYFVPLSILGGRPVTYREYLDYSSSVARDNIALLNGMHTFWTDGGMFSWGVDNKYWCFRLGLKSEQRVILRTPQLAGKIERIKYTPLQHLRSPLPDSAYFEDGGVSVRDGRTSYAVWGSGQGGLI